MNTLWQDVRYAIRTLAKNPGFTAVAVFTLALGIGADTGIFSLTQQVLLRALPVPHPEQLVLLYSPGEKPGHVSSDEGDGSESFSYPMYEDLRDHSTVFAGLAARFGAPVSLAVKGQTERVQADLISGNFFDVLGVHAAVGRTFTPDDDRVAGGHPVVLLSHGYWARRFGSDPSVLNQPVFVNNQAMTVVGIVQPGFDGVQLGRVPDVYVPISMKAQITPNWNGLDSRKDYWINLIGRLKPGVARAQAEAALAVIYRPLLESELPLLKGWSDQKRQNFLERKIVLHDGAKGRLVFQDENRQPLLVLMAMVGLVLLIACANVAGLLTARGAGRRKEISVRLALGASRWQLVRQLLIESCLLSMAGALVGLVIAGLTSSALAQFAAENQDAQGLSNALNLPVLSFAIGIGLLCGILFGIAPALRATRVDLNSALKDQSNSLSAGGRQLHLRKGLVISQIALSMLLITGAVGFARSLYNLQHVNLGLRPSHLLQFSVAPELNGYDPSRSIAFFQRLEDGITALPGVQAASGAVSRVIANDEWSSNITAEGESPDVAGTRNVGRNSVGPNYFSTIGIALMAGREFTRQDAAASPKVAIVNESFARQFFPGRNAIGLRFMFGKSNERVPDIEIVGIVKDSKHFDIREKVGAFVYQPYMQNPNAGELTYYVRIAQDPDTLAGAIRNAVQSLDPNLPVFNMLPFETQIERSFGSDRLLAILAALFGLLAALLAALGIYGLLAYTVAERTREIGIRIALGAEPKDVRSIVLRDLARLGIVGVCIGLPLTYGLGRITDALLFGVKSVDVFGCVSALALLAVIAALAASIPARRATRVDPMVALRYE